MAISAARHVFINLTGDYVANYAFDAAVNSASPGSVTTHNLSSGANTITVPVGFTVKGATIIPPSTNTQAITLKGIAGDTGIVISSTDPTSIGFETAPANFVLNAGGTITGLRIIWN